MLLKVALQQSGKPGTVTSLILGHFMNGIVDSVKTGGLGVLGNAELVFTSTSLSGSTLFQIGLRIPYTLTQQLGKTAGVVCLLESIALECLSYLRITFTVCLTGHCQIHTNLATLTVEVVAQVLNHLFTYSLGLAVTNAVNGSVGSLTLVLQF